MNDGFGQKYRKTSMGFLKGSHLTSVNKAGCSDAHRKNPNRHTRTYSTGAYGALSQKEQYKVNTDHRLSED